MAAIMPRGSHGAPLPPVAVRYVLASLLLLGGCGERVTDPDPDPSRIAIVHGDDQVAPAGSELATDLAVRVTDSRNRPVQSARIVWSVTEPEGFAIGAAGPTLTDAHGIARVRRTLGPHAGVHHTIAQVAFRPHLNVSFRSVGQIQGATLMTVDPADAGTSRSDTVLATLPPYALLLQNENGLPVAGVIVDWSALDGSVSSATSTTDDHGITRVSHTLGPHAGAQRVKAKVPGLIGSPVWFTADARPGQPTQLRAEWGDDHVGETDRTGAAYRAISTDDHDNLASGVAIEWEVTMGGGRIVSSSDTTPATAVHLLGPAEGVNTVTATARDLPGAPSVTFTTTAVTRVVYAQWDYSAGPGFSSPSTVITAGRTVGWVWRPCFYYCYYTGMDLHNITFEDDPTSPVSSVTHDAATLPAPRHFRTFMVPGTYRYRCTNHSTSFSAGMVGTVIVEPASS